MDDRRRSPSALRRALKRLLVPARRLLARPADLDARLAELTSEIASLRRTTDRLADEVGATILDHESSRPTRPTPEDRTVAQLLEGSFTPRGMPAFVELAFAAALGRAPSREDRERTLSRLREGLLTPSGLVDELASTGEFRENLLIERILLELPTDRPFGLDQPSWPGTTERVVEIPWVLSRCPQHGRVLEMGYAYALPCYLGALMGREHLVVHGIDAARRRVRNLYGTQADALRMPYRDASFDVVLCVSTLEHLGRDNSRYGLDLRGGGAPQALDEIYRVLKPGGYVLVTVPYGAYEDHEWFVQYDERSWGELTGGSSFETSEEDRFLLTEQGWVLGTSDDETASVRYGQGAPGARAVLCATLRRH